MRIPTTAESRNVIILTLAGLLLSALLAGCAGRGSGKAAIVDLGNGIYEVPSSGRLWQAAKSGESFATLEEAQQYVARLDLGGYTDWRLPTIYELYDLYLISDLKKAGAVELDLKGNYWSGEKDGEGMVGAWELGDQCDPERRYYEKKKGYVRAVRP
jgi:hypothetical protein